MQSRRFHQICWVLVFYTVLVIIWGAWVRISHSGDGCGNHWPLCEGAFIPEFDDHKTWIEYTHRLTSGLYGIFVLALFIYARKLFPKNHIARGGASLTFVLMIIEALLGAALVKKGLVGENATVYRAVMMTLHQVNSLLLTASTVILAYMTKPSLQNQLHRFTWKTFFLNGVNSIVFMLIPATGAWAALANTLFPSKSIGEGFEKDFAVDSPWILKLRVIHPLAALLVGLGLIYYFFKKSENADGESSKAALQVAGALSIAILFGILTLLFLSPVWMKLVHLTIAQALWITLVSYAFTSLLSTKR